MYSLYTGPGRWRKYDSKNCYDGNGADTMVPNPYSSALSLSDCQAACEADDSCEGIVVEKGREASGPCYKRKNIQPTECPTSGASNLYMKSPGMQKTAHFYQNRKKL